MIVLNLCCDHEHLFEGWFASTDAFEAQREHGQITCPICSSIKITRRPTAPYVNTGSASPAKAPAVPRNAAHPAALDPHVAGVMRAMLRHAGRDSEDVGERFVEEARRIHYGDSAARNIKGKASREDVGDLLDEGIVVLPLPADEDDLH